MVKSAGRNSSPVFRRAIASARLQPMCDAESSPQRSELVERAGPARHLRKGPVDVPSVADLRADFRKAQQRARAA